MKEEEARDSEDHAKRDNKARSEWSIYDQINILNRPISSDQKHLFHTYNGKEAEPDKLRV